MNIESWKILSVIALHMTLASITGVLIGWEAVIIWAIITAIVLIITIIEFNKK